MKKARYVHPLSLWNSPCNIILYYVEDSSATENTNSKEIPKKIEQTSRKIRKKMKKQLVMQGVNEKVAQKRTAQNKQKKFQFHIAFLKYTNLLVLNLKPYITIDI